MIMPKGCSVAGDSEVYGQCDAKACNYPFCEASGIEEEQARIEKIKTDIAIDLHYQLLGLA